MPVPGPLELIIVLVIALIVLGPGKLPDVGAALGKGIREFRKASSDLNDAARADPAPTPPPAAPPAVAPVSPPPAAAEPTTQPKP
jgi:sec-independent protein translocase protein TatA